MKNLILAAVVLFSCVIHEGYAQGFTAPGEGKAVVYFARVSSYGGLIPFDFFDGNAFIGDFAGKKYLRYECEPGEHLFWASSENKAFMTAELEANQSYVVIVDVIMGIGIARVGLSPIGPGDTVFPRAKNLIDKKAPVTVTQAQLISENNRLANFIMEKLQQYEDEWKYKLTIKHLSPEMTVTGKAIVIPPISH